MTGYICRCNKCGNYTVTTERVKKEIMRCGCGGILKEETECNIGVDLALASSRDTTEVVQLCASEEGIAIADGVLRIDKDDTLLLQSEYIFNQKTIDELQKEIKERTGINAALFDGRTKIMGVMVHGT